MENIQTYENFLNESIGKEVSKETASEFIETVLKLGSRDNLFDSFLKKKKLNPSELSTLVNLVTDELKTKWS